MCLHCEATYMYVHLQALLLSNVNVQCVCATVALLCNRAAGCVKGRPVMQQTET